MGFSIDGLVSGFDTTTIIESLLGFQQQQIDTFNSRKAEITTQQTSFKSIEAQMLTLQSSISRLNRPTSSVFDAFTATSSDENVIEVAASSSATAGNYQLTVESLAAAHQIASQAYSDTTEQIAQGDYTFTVGSGAAQTITVDATNNTLSSFVQAINDQTEDLSANLIYDQNAGGYRVLLSSDKTGAANTIAVSNTADAGTGTVADFSGTAVQEASDAQIRLGSGPGAITASYETNQIEDLISGVTLNLRDADASKTISIEVAQDNSSSVAAIDSFVTDFNSIIDFIDQQTAFNPESNQASPLTGNRSVSVIKNRLLTIVTDSIPSNSGLSRLSQIGVDVNTSGKLELDREKLTQALNGDIDTIDPNTVRNLFGINGTSSNSSIRFVTGGQRTLASDTPYQVDITQAAEQATVAAASALAGSVTIDGTNNVLQLSVDGVNSEPLTLAAGTYTQQELARHVESTINASNSLGVHNVSVSLTTGNELVITTEAYGASAAISSLSGSAVTTLGFDGTETDIGQNVAGNFIVNGVEEPGIGSGRVLIGNSSNENTADLQIEVNLSTAQITAGVEGEVEVTRGLTTQLDEYLSSILDGDTGFLKTINEDFEARIDSIDQSIENVEAITAQKRDSLIEEFTALETILNDLQTTGSFISSQLQSINAVSNNSNN
ncbi:MAG: flagellar filament capping protein FliD [Pirellulaceae bacterium]